MCKIANLAQNGSKLGRLGWPQCVGPKILGRGWTHQLPQASLERNLDICGPFFDVWFTKVETWKISKTGLRKVTLLQLRGGTKSDFAFVRPQLTQLTTQMQKSGQNWTFYGVFLKCKIAKIAKNSTWNRPYGPAGVAGAKIFGPKGVLPTSPNVPEKILEICNFHV